LSKRMYWPFKTPGNREWSKKRLQEKPYGRKLHTNSPQSNNNFQDYPHQLTFQGTEHEALSSHDLSHHRHGPYIMDDRSGMSTEQTE